MNPAKMVLDRFLSFRGLPIVIETQWNQSKQAAVQEAEGAMGLWSDSGKLVKSRAKKKRKKKALPNECQAPSEGRWLAVTSLPLTCLSTGK